MNIVVTGGSGMAGSAVVEELRQHGHEVLIIDQVRPRDESLPHKLVDLEDLGQVYGALQGAEAVAHLGAIPRPLFHTGDVVFRTNVMSTYNVFEAAGTLGITHIAYASSMSVLGYPFYHKFFEPHYVPMDEDHPTDVQDSYALSKLMGEEIGKAFCRRREMTAISLRLMWVHTPETFRELIPAVWDNPESEKAAPNLWGYIDTRDVAQAFRLALESDLSGHHPFFIGAPNTFMKTPTAELMQKYYPNSKIRPELEGNQAIVSTQKAERLLGFKARYRWESYF